MPAGHENQGGEKSGGCLEKQVVAAGQQIQQAFDIAHARAACLVEADTDFLAQVLVGEIHLSSPVMALAGCATLSLSIWERRLGLSSSDVNQFLMIIPNYGIKTSFLAIIELNIITILQYINDRGGHCWVMTAATCDPDHCLAHL